MTMIVSNTEITSKNTCDKQHDYMYNQELEPRKYSLSIRRGQAGHAVLERYYQCRQAALDHDQAVEEAMLVLYKIIGESDPEDTDHTEMLGHLSWLLIKYFEEYRLDTYKVLAVEKLHTAPMLVDDIHFGLYLDVLAEHTTGEWRGYVDIIDHKFVNNFKSIDDLRLDGQQPKYWKVAQLNGLPIKSAIFNQIRYRKMKNPGPSDLFRRSPLLSSKAAVDTIWAEASGTAWDISEEKRIKLDEFYTDPPKPRRTLSYSACKNCFFKDLCLTELAGEDTTIMRQAQYQKRNRPLKDWMLSNV